jgi:AraC-like DNA-binding protein
MAAMSQLPERARILGGTTAGSRWEMAARRPAGPMRPYVSGDYVGYSEWTTAPSRRREFPTPFVVLVLEFGPPIRVYDYGDERRSSRHRGGFVAGLDDRFCICEHGGFQQGLQINLTPIGARLLFGVPMSELTGRIVSVYDVLPARYRGLGDRLQELASWDARFELLDRLLGASIAEARTRTNVVAWAVDRIEQSGGAIEMRSLARELGYSRKHVIDLFRDQVGIPPKLLARIVRFDRLVQHLKRGSAGTWADLALEFGYYDQAHLIRDVKQFTGTTPGQVRPLLTDAYGLFA